VFPGTKCEYDSASAFEKYGAKTLTEVFRTLHIEDISNSLQRLAAGIQNSQILMLSGGFSAGDEPDGSGKFIAAILNSNQVRDSIEELLNRDGLILGICNGFQALIKSGLLPYGKFGNLTTNSPTLIRNEIGRHVSRIVHTRVASTLSPWYANSNVGDIHSAPISSGEGRFYASPTKLQELVQAGQIATQYVDDHENATMDGRFNPNGSTAAIEGITSKDGRVLGKMTHPERGGRNLLQNVPGNFTHSIFQAGVNYFTG
jgi:phosphoribosylformylglycinamidine synthase